MTGGGRGTFGQEHEAVRFTLHEPAEHVALVRLDRPQVHNALNRQAYRELEACFRHASADDEVRCVLLTGTDPSFCSGDDVRELMAAPASPDTGDGRARLRAVRPEPTPAAVAVLECQKPVVAAINGAAVGWGMELAMFADIRIASEKARFGELFVKRGLVSDVGGLLCLPRLVGPEKAAELLFTGEIVDAHEAARIGLVSRVVPHAELLERASDLAARISSNPPLAVRYLKEGLRLTSGLAGAGADLRATGGWVSRTLGVLFETEDHAEGVRAFLEKRPPRFFGR